MLGSGGRYKTYSAPFISCRAPESSIRVCHQREDFCRDAWRLSPRTRTEARAIPHVVAVSSAHPTRNSGPTCNGPGDAVRKTGTPSTSSCSISGAVSGVSNTRHVSRSVEATTRSTDGPTRRRPRRVASGTTSRPLGRDLGDGGSAGDCITDRGGHLAAPLDRIGLIVLSVWARSHGSKVLVARVGDGFTRP